MDDNNNGNGHGVACFGNGYGENRKAAVSIRRWGAIRQNPDKAHVVATRAKAGVRGWRNGFQRLILSIRILLPRPQALYRQSRKGLERCGRRSDSASRGHRCSRSASSEETNRADQCASHCTHFRDQRKLQAAESQSKRPQLRSCSSELQYHRHGHGRSCPRSQGARRVLAMLRVMLLSALR